MNNQQPRPEYPSPLSRWRTRVTGRLPVLVRTLRELRHRYDLVLLLTLAVLAAGAFGFVQLAETVTEGEARTVDERLLLAFRHAGDLSDPLGNAEVEEAVRDLTALGGLLLSTLFTLFVVGYLLLDRRPRAAAFLLGAVAGGVALTFLLKFGFDRPRPDLVAHAMEALSPSFPSGHSATSAVVYLSLGALLARALPRRRLKAYVVVAAVLVTLGVGVSRVYLGVHWPTDVLAGWTLGAVWALGCWLLARYFRRRGWIERGSRLVPPKRQPEPLESATSQT